MSEASEDEKFDEAMAFLKLLDAAPARRITVTMRYLESLRSELARKSPADEVERALRAALKAYVDEDCCVLFSNWMNAINRKAKDAGPQPDNCGQCDFCLGTAALSSAPTAGRGE